MRLVGISKAMENFKETEYKGMCRAEQVIKKIKGKSRKYEQETIVYQNLEDKHFINAVAQSGDDNLKRLVKHMREVKKPEKKKSRGSWRAAQRNNSLSGKIKREAHFRRRCFPLLIAPT